MRSRYHRDKRDFYWDDRAHQTNRTAPTDSRRLRRRPNFPQRNSSDHAAGNGGVGGVCACIRRNQNHPKRLDCADKGPDHGPLGPRIVSARLAATTTSARRRSCCSIRRPLSSITLSGRASRVTSSTTGPHFICSAGESSGNYSPAPSNRAAGPFATKETGQIRGSERTLPDGVSAKQAHEWRKAACRCPSPRPEFQAWVKHTREVGGELVTCSRPAAIRGWLESQAGGHAQSRAGRARRRR